MIEIHNKNIYSELFGRPNTPEKNIFIRLMKVSQARHEPKINHVARNMLILPNENFLLKTNAWFSPSFALDDEERGAEGGGGRWYRWKAQDPIALASERLNSDFSILMLLV